MLPPHDGYFFSLRFTSTNSGLSPLIVDRLSSLKSGSDLGFSLSLD